MFHCHQVNFIKSLLAGLLIASGPTLAMAENTAGNRDLKPEQEVINTVTAPTSDLSVKVSVNNKKGIYQLGDALELSVTTNKDAYVTVLNIGVNGTTTILYPYQDGTNNLIKAGETRAISGKNTGVTIKFHAPAGTDLVKAFASTKKIPLLDPAHITKATSRIGVATQKARNLVPAMQQTIDNNSDKISWAIDTIKVTSVDKNAAAPIKDAGQIVQVAKPFGFTIKTDKLVYKIGEPVQLSVTSKKDCKLKLYNIGTSGAVRLIYPNKAQPNDMIKADKELMVPEKGKKTLLASIGPAGVESVLALCTTKDAAVVGTEADFINQLFPKVGEWPKLDDRNLAVIAAPQANANHGETVRAALALLVR
ncbi:MAG: DUF4384 domain-containing protein [Cohaesibacter sp.]|jgi:hypothetical protein|nr:DUF4384 domain-containing protein [Cohaesibacter sp.]